MNWYAILKRIMNQVKARTDSLPASPANEETSQAMLATEVRHDSHFHNREKWFGIQSPQTAADWALEEGLAPFVAISGANDFGTDPGDEAQVLGSDDTPVFPGQVLFDLRRISVVDVSNATPFVLRFIWGTGTIAEAEAAGQYTEIVIHQQTAAGQNKPQDILFEKLAVGTKVWCRAKNATNNATVSFLVGVHGYPP